MRGERGLQSLKGSLRRDRGEMVARNILPKVTVPKRIHDTLPATKRAKQVTSKHCPKSGRGHEFRAGVFDRRIGATDERSRTETLLFTPRSSTHIKTHRKADPPGPHNVSKNFSRIENEGAVPFHRHQMLTQTLRQNAPLLAKID